ncbi:steroid receptor-associated and regulated protein [Erinaceus europaeus]|uniref:Steroid receptor-associated and regulated protein n=1 Tax=Erinaceus europaeus TaxID=9365 RepID=A0A1S3WC15_ERIEU|nr:steroid receptor-associated and regulated protein [Erinaceus europaeus]
MDLDRHLATSSGDKLVRPQKAIPATHLTFLIDCTHGKSLSLMAPPEPSPAPTSTLGPATPLMKTYILFCGENSAPLNEETPLSGELLAQVGDTLPPPRDVAPASSPVSPLCLQEVPKAKGNPLKTVSVRHSAWGTVKGSLKGFLSSCVCGQAD